MKKQFILGLSLIAFFSTLVSCDNKGNSNSNETESTLSSEVKDSESPSTSSFEYLLEENEGNGVVKTTVENMSELTYDTIKIQGVSNLVVDPYESFYYYGAAILRYPTAELLKDKIILYTSAWYSRNTFKRSDDCFEYVLANDEGQWYIDSISNNSETFIPFNGAVLSIPKSSNVKFDAEDLIYFTKGSIPSYELGVYNQDGYRIAIGTSNRTTWNSDKVNLFDSNYLSKVTPSSWDKVATINCYYDASKQAYVVDKFRALDDKGRVYTNVNNGFVLAATLKSSNENCSVINGARFSLNDTIKFESDGTLYDKYFDFVMPGQNNYQLDNGDVISFTMTKSSSYVVGGRWTFEVGLNKNNVIVSCGSNVDLPTDGSKLSFNCVGSTTGESSNRLLENVFTKGSRVVFSGNSVKVLSSINQRVTNYYNITTDYLNSIKNDIAKYNYSYNLEEIERIATNLPIIKEEIDKVTKLSSDPTMLYRLNSLLGNINQEYFNLTAATNRNEAVQVKSCWYITDFANNDKDLASIQKNLDRIKASGTNEIIIPVLNDGTSYYNNSLVFKTHRNVKDYGEYGQNYVKAITSEAHKRGMSVFGGMTPYTEGIEYNWSELKECFALSVDGAESVNTSQGSVKMLDPSNPLVQEKIKETVDDILKCNPELDGLQLDYIRFGADNNQVNKVMGVTESARVGFNKFCIDNDYGYNAASLADLRKMLKSNNLCFSVFNLYQQNLVTDTVKNIKEVCLKYKAPLICAVADNSSYVKTWKCQDWGTWAQKGYVDALYLMDYYFDEYWINYYFEDMVNATNNKSLLIAGIDPSYAGLIAEFYPKTIKGGLTNPNSVGYAIFGTHTQNAKKDGWDLIASSNWIDSISPYAPLKDTMKASSDLLLSRCDSLYIKYDNQTQSQKESLKADLDALCALATSDDISVCNDVIDKLNAMLKNTYASNEASKRIKEQLTYMLKIAKGKLNTVKESIDD